MGDAAAAPYIGAPIVWLVAGAPFRVLSNTQGFLLHALGRGGSVLTWKLAEIPAKAAANVLFMQTLGFGFAGCFLAGCIVAAASSFWLWTRLHAHGARRIRLPEIAFARSFLSGTFWEALRVLSPQAAMLFSLTLFSLPWRYATNGQRLELIRGRANLHVVHSWSANHADALSRHLPAEAISGGLDARSCARDTRRHANRADRRDLAAVRPRLDRRDFIQTAWGLVVGLPRLPWRFPSHPIRRQHRAEA